MYINSFLGTAPSVTQPQSCKFLFVGDTQNPKCIKLRRKTKKRLTSLRIYARKTFEIVRQSMIRRVHAAVIRVEDILSICFEF